MEKPLRAHIASLENRVRILTEIAATPNCSPEERNLFQAEILTAEQALRHYRTAYDLEQHLHWVPRSDSATSPQDNRKLSM